MQKVSVYILCESEAKVVTKVMTHDGHRSDARGGNTNSMQYVDEKAS